MRHVISAIELVSYLEGISKQESKRLLKQSAVSIADNENSPLRKIRFDEVFEIETNSHR